MFQEVGGVVTCKMTAQEQRLIWWVLELQAPSRSKVVTERVSLGVQSDVDFFDTPQMKNAPKMHKKTQIISVFNTNPK